MRVNNPWQVQGEGNEEIRMVIKTIYMRARPLTVYWPRNHSHLQKSKSGLRGQSNHVANFGECFTNCSEHF